MLLKVNDKWEIIDTVCKAGGFLRLNKIEEQYYNITNNDLSYRIQYPSPEIIQIKTWKNKLIN